MAYGQRTFAVVLIGILQVGGLFSHPLTCENEQPSTTPIFKSAQKDISSSASEDRWAAYSSDKVNSTEGGMRQLVVAMQTLKYYKDNNPDGKAGVLNRSTLMTASGAALRGYDIFHDTNVEGTVNKISANAIKLYEEMNFPKTPGVDFLLNWQKERLAIQSNLQDAKDIERYREISKKVMHKIYEVSQNDPEAAIVFDGILSETKDHKILVPPGTRESNDIESLAKLDPDFAKKLHDAELDGLPSRFYQLKKLR
jgi:hypothetical protein